MVLAQHALGTGRTWGQRGNKERITQSLLGHWGGGGILLSLREAREGV